MNRGELTDRVLRSTLRPVERLMVLAYVSHLPSTLPDGSPAPVEFGRAWPGRERLAAMCGCGLTATKRARARLVELGVLEEAGEVRQTPAYRLRPAQIPVQLDPPRIKLDESQAELVPAPVEGGREATRSECDPVASRPRGGREATEGGSRGDRGGVARRPRTLLIEPSSMNPLQEPSTESRAAAPPAVSVPSGLPPFGLGGAGLARVSEPVLQVLQAWHAPWAARMAPGGTPEPGDAERVVCGSEVRAAHDALQVLALPQVLGIVRMRHECPDGRPQWWRSSGQGLRGVLKRASLHESVQMLRRWESTGSAEPGGAKPGRPARRRAGDLSDVLGGFEVEGDDAPPSVPSPLLAPRGADNVVPLRAAGRS